MTYAEKLKDPRWQKRRLEILKRDDFACQICLDASTELHVHHVIYRAGRDPWEYPDEDLKTVCAPCHERIKKLLETIGRQFFKMPNPWTVPWIYTFFRDLMNDPEVDKMRLWDILVVLGQHNCTVEPIHHLLESGGRREIAVRFLPPNTETKVAP